MSLLDRFGALSTPVVSDALDELGIHGVISACSSQITSRASETGGATAGYALPVRFEPIANDPQAYRFGGGVGRPLEQVLKTMQKDDLVVFDLAGSHRAACWGGLASRLAMQRGVRGVVIWGCVRDVQEVEELHFPVWSVGRTPRRSRNDFTFGSLGERIEVDGIQVESGDIVVGDATGVLVVPSARGSEVIDLAERIEASEEGMLEQIRAEDAAISWDQV